MWLLIAILGYFFLALVSLFDRYLLAGPLPSAQSYVFFTGILGLVSLALIPFGFVVPDISQILFSLFAGGFWMLAISLLFLAILQNEVSRVMPAIAGFLPIFTLIIAFLFSSTKVEITFHYIFALLLLISGSILITFKKDKAMLFKNIKMPFFAAFAFAIGFFLMKMVYLEQAFISGFIWMRIGGALSVLPLLFSTKMRQVIFKKKPLVQKQVSFALILGQAFGGLGFALQSYSVALADISQIPLINALEGVRYVFLLLFIIILGKKFPNLLKEQVSKKAIIQKTLAVLLIGLGLILLAFQ